MHQQRADNFLVPHTHTHPKATTNAYKYQDHMRARQLHFDETQQVKLSDSKLVSKATMPLEVHPESLPNSHQQLLLDV